MFRGVGAEGFRVSGFGVEGLRGVGAKGFRVQGFGF